ncbi:hypothetical protein ACFYRY_08340 [Streptomyces sp. NPDC005263]
MSWPRRGSRSVRGRRG